MATDVLSPEEAARLVRDVDTLAVPLGPGQPSGFLHALGEREFEHLDLFGALLIDLYAVFTKPGVHYKSGFFGPAERFLFDSGADIQFVPSDFRRFTPILERLAPRVMATAASPPDADGYLSLSLHAGASFHELLRCAADPERLLIVEANAQLPRTYGVLPDYPHRVHVDQVDCLVATDRPVIALADPPPTAADEAIAGFVRPYVTDGCTLQTGIGGIPSTVVSHLATDEGGDYGVHSEMFTNGLMKLHQAGKVTNSRKGTFDGFSVTTFAFGTPELYEWLHENDAVRFLPVDVVNSPETIARNHRMVTINGALAIDLWGQVVADTIGGRQFSGIGGHEDFVSVSGLELEDRSLLCFPSTAMVAGERRSRIVAQFPAGSVITTPRHQLDLVVTEFGVASLRGRTIAERAHALADIAHPDYRDELRVAAAALR